MQITVYKHNNGDCPYLPDRTWETHFFQAELMPEEVYEIMLNQGWRRSGSMFYQNQCDNCTECIPIRVDVENFKASKSQRKCRNRNKDITVTREPASFDHQDFDLFRKYDRYWHKSDSSVDEELYRSMNIDTPLDTQIMRYFIDGNLVGLGWIDVLPDSLSSVYFSFDPDYADRSLGVFSMLTEIELCRELGKSWLQVGFYVPECDKMNYKAKYKPYQLLINGEWRSS